MPLCSTCRPARLAPDRRGAVGRPASVFDLHIPLSAPRFTVFAAARHGLAFRQHRLSPNLSGLLSDPSLTSSGDRRPRPVADPDRAVSQMVAGSPGAVAQAALDQVKGPTIDQDWRDRWNRGEQACRLEIDRILDGDDNPSEPRAARDLTAMPLDALVVGSSMPVRDVDWFAHRTPANVIGNRGASGIDGLSPPWRSLQHLGAAGQHRGRSANRRSGPAPRLQRFPGGTAILRAGGAQQ